MNPNDKNHFCILNPEEYSKTSDIIINTYDDIDINISAKCGQNKSKVSKPKNTQVKEDINLINSFDKAILTNDSKLNHYKQTDFTDTRKPIQTNQIDKFEQNILSLQKNEVVGLLESSTESSQPNQQQSLLQCEKGNQSKTCPPSRCHLDYHKDFYFPVDRVVMNLGDKKVLPDYRSIKEVCHKYKEDGNNETLRNQNLKDDRYFKNVDVENDLLNLDYPHGCAKERMIDVSEFEKQGVQNYQDVRNFNYNLANFTSSKDRYPVNKCQNINEKNYCSVNLQTPTTNKQFPVANFQMNEVPKAVQCRRFLPIGPVRDDKPHCETDWNNVTYPKAIRRPQKKYALY